MTRFEYFLKYGTEGLNLGIIPVDMFAKFIRYQVYLNYMKDGNKSSEAMKLASDECCCEITSIYKAKYFFAEGCKD